MMVTLIDTFTSTVFPNAYYEEFYIYFYILQYVPLIYMTSLHMV